jgi:putative membrane protein
MESEYRLHPFSIVFAFLSQIRAFIVPGLLVLLGARSRGGDWEPWMMVLVIPAAIAAAVRYISYRYRYDPNEIVIRSGLVFRKERHIPYARIQNIDAVQRPLHRLLNVVEVRLETGAGQTPEATMSVLPLTAFREMRERVFAGRGEASTATDAGGATGKRLLELSLRDLLLFGFIENRGAVVIATAFGVLWEFGGFERGIEMILGEQAASSGRGVVRDLARGLIGNTVVTFDRLAITLAAFAGLLLFVRVISMGWAVVRLYGFRLSLAEEDLRSEYGLLTRVAATIPLRRVQALSIRETPLHRLFGRVSIKANTAGGVANEVGRSEREWLAPLLRREEVPSLVQQVIGERDIDRVGWQPVASRAFRREVKGWIATAAAIQGVAFWVFGWWWLVLAPALILWAIVGARKTVSHLGWAVTGEAVMFRTGWLWRRVTIVRFAKIQTVTLAETPFDRRTVMARVRVDTAGASESSRIDVPYLPQPTALALHSELAHHAALRQFEWS